MMKHEFEQRIERELTPEEYKIVEHVYTWHPAIPNVGGKDVLAQIFKLGGMTVMLDMDGSATAAEAIYEQTCDKLRKNVHQKGIILERMAELQNQLNKLSADFDELTAETERLQMIKEQHQRGN